MRFRFLIAVVFFLSVTPLHAAELRGIVLLNELSGAPLANVSVAAVQPANPTVTDSMGKFVLNFPQLKPGDKVEILTTKPGYQVINYVQLHLNLPLASNSETLTILLSKPENFEQMARLFYRLKGDEAVEKNYRERVAALENEYRDDKQRLSKALKLAELERDQAKAALEQTSSELAKLKPEEMSETYRQAMALYLDGKIDEALAMLDEAKLRRTAEIAKKQKADAEKAQADAEQTLADTVRSFLLRADLLTIQFKFDEAEKAYRAAAELAPDDFEVHFKQAFFQGELNRYGKALPLYRHCLALARNEDSPEKIAMTLNNLGILFSDQNRQEDARTAYEEALKIRRELAARNPETYLPYVATTLNNLGVLFRAQNRQEDARTAYEEALKTYRELAARNPETYLPDVAMTLNNLGVLLSDQNRQEDARTAYEEALKTYRELAARNPETYLPYVATTLNNLGVLYAVQSHFEEALTVIEESLSIYEAFAKNNPERYSVDVEKGSKLKELVTQMASDKKLNEK